MHTAATALLSPVPYKGQSVAVGGLFRGSVWLRALAVGRGAGW
jgi:hypothetical protein